MKKLLFVLSALFTLFLCHGATLDVNGSFAKVVKKTGLPAYWQLNRWKGYQPLAKWELLTEKTGKVLHVFEVKGKSGFGLHCNRYFEAAAGDEIVISAEVKGKGSGSFGLQLRDAKGNHRGQTQKGGYFTLSQDWKKVLLKIKVINSSKGETAKITITLSGAKGSELFVRNIAISSDVSDIAGSAPFPREWQLFAPVAADLVVKTDAVPAEINGVSGKRTLITGSRNTLDFSGFFPKRKLRNTGWAFAEMTSPTDEKHTFGVGADYFFALYVNGKKVLDTLKNGNAVGNPPHFNNYLVTVPLKKAKIFWRSNSRAAAAKKPISVLAEPTTCGGLPAP